MLYANNTHDLRIGVIKRFHDGDLRVICPDGTIERVAAHRPDLALALATGSLVPKRRAKAPAKPAATPPRCELTRGQVQALGALLTPLADRLKALEKGRAKAQPKHAPPASKRETWARIELALARAETALRRAS